MSFGAFPLLLYPDASSPENYDRYKTAIEGE